MSVVDAESALAHAEDAYARFDVDAVVAHLSAAIRGFTAAGDQCRAAMACARLGDTFANALGNLTAARAWFARAWRLVEDLPECVEQGWVAVAAMGCDVDDPDKLLSAADLALDRARRFGDVNLETKALADGGLARVQMGRVTEGMAMLDEAMALACGPADNGDTTAKSVCSFFTACYYATDFARAGSWADLLRRRGVIGSTPGGQLFLSSHCDSVQATLLMELGRWNEAEQILQHAVAQFEAGMGMPAWHPSIALGDLRVRQGRLADAESLLVGKDNSIQALLPTAHLHLARGDHALAAAVARRGLRAVGDDRLRAVELLTLLVDAELAGNRTDRAREAADELVRRLDGVDVPALVARASAARARLLAASDAVADAVAVLEDATDAVDGRELPWLRSSLLLELARHRERKGDLDGARAEAAVASSLLANLDVVLRPEDRNTLDRLVGQGASANEATEATRNAVLARDGRWWQVTVGPISARLRDTKGLRYVAELIARAGAECHVFDLVDAAEGVDAERAVDRRSLGDAGEHMDSAARAAYRHQIEALREDVDDALAAGRLEDAEKAQGELDQLVAELARAYGLSGRERRASSAAERARLNVTRAIRSAVAGVEEALPAAGASLDRQIRTGLYCSYSRASDEFRWIVQS